MFRGREFFLSFLRYHIVIQLLFVVFVVIVLFGSIIHLVEPNNFLTIFDGIYWALVTTSTVGFGDYVPLTNTGRTIAMILILVGGGFVTFYMATVSRVAVQSQQNYQEGKGSHTITNHIILVGWNERTKEIIKQLRELYPLKKIILIDHTLKTNPYKHRLIHFVKGDPTNDQTLIRANIKEADSILITSDAAKTEPEADMHAILTLLAVKGINRGLYTLVEIQTLQQTENARRAGADEIIETNQFAGYLMTNSLFSHGITASIQELFNHLEGHRLITERAPAELVTQTFSYASSFLLENNILLLGIKKGERITINPPPSYIIQTNDYIIIISS